MGDDQFSMDPVSALERAAGAAGKAALASLEEEPKFPPIERIIVIVDTPGGQGATTYNPDTSGQELTQEQLDHEALEMTASLLMMLRTTFRAMGKEVVVVGGLRRQDAEAS